MDKAIEVAKDSLLVNDKNKKAYLLLYSAYKKKGNLEKSNYYLNKINKEFVENEK